MGKAEERLTALLLRTHSLTRSGEWEQEEEAGEGQDIVRISSLNQSSAEAKKESGTIREGSRSVVVVLGRFLQKLQKLLLCQLPTFLTKFLLSLKSVHVKNYVFIPTLEIVPTRTSGQWDSFHRASRSLRHTFLPFIMCIALSELFVTRCSFGTHATTPPSNGAPIYDVCTEGEGGN